MTGGTGWSWPYFILGVVLGLVAVVGLPLIKKLVYASVHAPAEAVAKAQERTKDFSRGTGVTTLVIAVGVAILSAALESPWPDIVLGVFVLITLLVPLLMLPWLRRRMAVARANGELPDRSPEH